MDPPVLNLVVITKAPLCFRHRRILVLSGDQIEALTDVGDIANVATNLFEKLTR